MCFDYEVCHYCFLLVKINGKPKGHIVPSRGIRQGDPLSPYLFLLCAEGLSALIKKEVENGRLGGVAKGSQNIPSFLWR